MGAFDITAAAIRSRLVGLNRNHTLIAKEGLVAGRHRVVEWSDDFLGDAIDAKWAVTKGSDGACVDFAHLTGLGGIIRATTGAGAGGSMAANGVQLHSALQWRASAGNLVMEARVRLSAITNISLFVGLTDQIAALEMPIHSAASANTITTNATDAVGVFFDTSMSADNFWLAGVKNDVDATHQNTAVAPVADTWHRIRMEIDASGNADFWIDGARVGTTVAAAVTAATMLTPVIAAFTRTAASATVDVDYVQLLASRV